MERSTGAFRIGWSFRFRIRRKRRLTIDVAEDWWQELFDELYLQTDARSVCDETLTLKEVDFLEKTLDLSASIDGAAPILDLCGGQGRHALELASRGYTDLTVLDYSACLIDLGRQKACADSLNVAFIQGDARSTGLPARTYRYIIIMGSSFGYFADEAENCKILIEARRLLAPEGVLLLDLPDKTYVTQYFKPASVHRINSDLEVRRSRKLEEDIIFSREIVISDAHGRLRDHTYCTRLYSPDQITLLLRANKFDTVDFQTDFMCRKGEADYGTMTNRMIVKAKKAA